MAASKTKMFDWRPEDFDPSRGPSAAIVVSALGEQVEQEGADALRSELRADLVHGLQEVEVFVEDVDPYVGAGGHGLGILLQFLDTGAAVITWGTAAVLIAPRLRTAIARIRQRLRVGDQFPGIALSAEAVQILVTAEVCEREGIAPQDIAAVGCLSHVPRAPEPRTELEQIYAAHTVSVSYHDDDGFYRTWIYTVSPQGNVFSASDVMVPVPNGTHWYQVDLPERRLNGLA